MKGTELTIRTLNTADAAAFQALRLAATIDSPAAIWPTYEEQAGLSPDQIETIVTPSDTQVVYGVFAHDTLIGIAGLRRETFSKVSHKGTVWGVFVAPSARGAGAARMLLNALIAHAREAGIEQLHLLVNTENTSAQALYRCAGFETYGIEPRALRVNGRYYDEAHMLLRLRAGTER
jgi:ribosomal protein S18 acetylase RimI-like enzyme